MTIDKFLLPQTIDVFELEVAMSPVFGGQNSIYQVELLALWEKLVVWMYIFLAGAAAVVVAFGAALLVLWALVAVTTVVKVIKFGVTVKGLP
jgi:anti-sigma-K factor RskA